MNPGITYRRKIHFGHGHRSRREVREGPSPEHAPKGNVPRVSRLMALAIRFDQLIRERVVADQADIARLGRVTRARITQIMNLLNLAPDIQEAILFLPPIEKGKDPIAERDLRPIAAEADWAKQTVMWNELPNYAVTR